MSDLPIPAQIADCVDVATAAAWLQVSADTIRGWVLRGILAPAYNVGSPGAPRYRIPRSTLLAKLELVQPLRLE